MKKKLLSALLAVAMLLSVAGCGGNGATQEPSAAPESKAPTSTVESTPTTVQDPKDFDEVIETDILVIGGGGTGLTAALSASEQGKNVLVLEKMAYVGGATLMSAGKVPAAGTKQQAEANIEDDPAALTTDILRPGDYGQRADLVKLVANNAKDFIEWSEGQGVTWALETNLLYYGQTAYRMHVSEDGGSGLVKSLSGAVEAKDNITVMTETTGTGLLTDETGAVIGGTAINKEGKTLYIKAKATVLATSGFGANREMVEQYVPSIANAYPLVAPGATGEGILWGMQLGAEVRNMSAYQGYAPISFETKKGLGQTMTNNGGFLVNAEGHRFMDEYTGYSNLAAGIVNQTDAYAYMIWDTTIAAGQEETIAQWKDAGILFEGATVAELATAIGVDEAALQKEMDAYTAGIESGKDYLDRTYLPETFEGPYYAVKVTGDFRHTQGGLAIDLNTRVLKTDGTPIPGLYAGGGVTEGFSSSGGPAYMSGNGLLQALVLGKLAGEEAANY